MLPNSRIGNEHRFRDIAGRSGFIGALARFWRHTYAADYVCLIGIAIGWALVQTFDHPFHRMFSLDNVALQYPFSVEERVPVAWSIVYSGVIPLAVITAWAVVIRPELHFAHVSILGLLCTLVLTSFVTDVIKNSVGRPRPDLISRCDPERGTPDHTLVGFTVCSAGDAHILEEGWRSFPSGHSSFAFGGLGYLSLFFAGQLHVYRPRTGLARFLFSASPLFGALMIALSRLADYRHDVYDILCGALLGILIAYFLYRRYYPALRAVDCDTPYTRGDIQATGFHRVADDEEQQMRTSSPTSQLGDPGPGHRTVGSRERLD